MSNSKVLALYITHQQDLLDYARRIVRDVSRAEDIIQDAYLRFRDVAQEQWPDKPVAYLYRIVRNLAMDNYRRTRLENHLFNGTIDDIAGTQPSQAPSVERGVIASQELHLLNEALAELPTRTRVAIEMHRLGGYKLREIAEHLDISSSMAQYLIKEGIKHCQQRLRRADSKH